jgi:hypothetical protein
MPAMHADFELDANGAVKATPPEPKYRDPFSRQGQGGGRPVGYSPKAAKAMEQGLNADDPNERTKLAFRKAEALTLKEEALAKSAALKYEIDSGNYLPRDAFREASATLLAEVAQGVRSLPDLLERKANLTAEQVAICERVIDEALSTLSGGLELFTEQKPAGS